MLSLKEKERYQRQLILKGLGEKAQEVLKKSRVAIFGLGGLGSPVSLYLAASGVGHLYLFDYQRVELSNLNRQILYQTKDIGEVKSEVAKKALLALNPEIEVKSYSQRLEEAVEIWKEADLLIDCLDNLEGRLFLNKFAVKQKKPLISAGVEGWDGYLYTYLPQKTPCLNCIFGGKTNKEGIFPVIGVTPGILGMLEAAEAIKYLLSMEVSSAGQILFFNLESFSFSLIKVRKNFSCEVCR